jgi:hypothetical protein
LIRAARESFFPLPDRHNSDPTRNNTFTAAVTNTTRKLERMHVAHITPCLIFLLEIVGNMIIKIIPERAPITLEKTSEIL